jgi:glutathione peroxidase
MKKILKITFILIFIVMIASSFTLIKHFISKKDTIETSSIKAKESILNYGFTDTQNNEIKLNKFKNKYILIVNVASNCGFTYQYEGLQKLYDTYKNSVEIIAFPCNQFLFQEPYSNTQIAESCKLNYGVEFTIAQKTKVKGRNKHSIYNWLSNKKLNGWNSKTPTWNFCKYLIDKEGNLVAFFGPQVEPMNSKITEYFK